MGTRAVQDLPLRHSRLTELLSYDADVGVFTWRISRNNSRSAGCAAGSLSSDGYWRIRADGHTYCAHRLAWFYMNGRWPQSQVDHINGDKADNRFANLRDVTPTVNQQNQRRSRCNSQSGLLGVYRQKRKWRAQICVAGRKCHIGLFDSPESAHRAYVEAKRQLHEGCTV